MTSPRPSPSTSIAPAASTVDVDASSPDRSTMPTAMIAVPAIGNAL